MNTVEYFYWIKSVVNDLVIEKWLDEQVWLGPLLFVLHISDLPEVVENNMKLNADNSKSLGIVDTLPERRDRQRNLDCLSDKIRE